MYKTQLRHLEDNAVNPRKNLLHGRVMRTALAAVLAGLMAFPSPAFAAERVYVGGYQYTEAANGNGANGGTWSWNGADDMVLDNYNGDNIAGVGNLNIELVGDNTIEADYGPLNADMSSAISEYSYGNDEGNLAITGDGTLNVIEKERYQQADYDSTASYLGEVGVYSAGDLTIDGAKISIDVSEELYGYKSGLYANNIDIINGSVVSTSNANGTGIDARNGILIKDSTVSAVTDGDYAIEGGGNINIENSNVTARGTEHAVYSQQSLYIANTDIAANTTVSTIASEGILAEAEAGASQGAAIAAKGGITLRDVNLYGATVAVDEDGIYYVVNADGTTGSVSMKHTGAASKYVNGVGNTGGSGSGGSSSGSGSSGSGGSSSGGSASGSAADGIPTRTASTGGGILQMVADALSRTFDPTSFGPVTGAVLAAAAALTASASVRRRRGVRTE